MEDDISAATAFAPADRSLAARLLGGILVGFVAGVALQLQQATLLILSIYGFMGAGSALLLIGLARYRPGQRVALMVALLASAALGFGLTGVRATLFQANALNPALEGQDILITGQVLAMPQFGEEGVRFRFGVASARVNGQPVRLPPQVFLGWYAGFGARVNKAPLAAPPGGSPDSESGELPEFSPEQQRQPQTLRAGERWEMTVRLKAPHGNSNPYGFDYELWLWEQGLQATGYVRSGPKDTPPRKLASTWAHPVERVRQSVRAAIFERIDDRKLAGVLAALVVGDQNAIERADWDVFRATGVAHLMSISGLHITMFAWAASLVIAWLWRRSVRWTPALCLRLPASAAGAWGGLLLAALYALFSGLGVPAQRTIWMLATVVLLRQSGKQWPWPFVWLLAMAVVVTLDPWALMQAGFWLSFVAVGVLFATGPPQGKQDAKETGFATNSGALGDHNTGAGGINDAEKSVWRRNLAFWLARPVAGLAHTAREQWIVTLALTPLSLLLFNQVSLVGLLANAVAIPWVTLVVTPLAMLGVFWPPVWDFAAWAVSLLAVFLQWLAAWPIASISVAAAPLWCAIAGVAGGVLLAVRLPWHWWALGVPLMLPVLLWQPLRPVEGQFEILGADIGQGNALVVRTAGHSLVYDTGPRFSSESDAGNRVLVPLLRAMGERVDVLMLSHRDLDHIGAAMWRSAQPAEVLCQRQSGARYWHHRPISVP